MRSTHSKTSAARSTEQPVTHISCPTLLASLALALITHSASAAESMTIRADLTEAPRGLIRGTLSLPVKSGPLTLVYPQWIPGYHSPIGPITDLSGLKFTANRKPVTWRRDLIDMYAFHVDVPAGATTLDISLEYLAHTGASTNDPNTTSQLAVLEWNLITLFPKGSDAAKITVEPSVVLPTDWKFGCSMPQAAGAAADGAIHFKPVSLEMLIDQPVLAGRHYKQVDLTPAATPHHVIDIAADSDAALALSAERLKNYRRVPAEYAALFGARHYERYNFLLALSDRTGYNGLEHHQCSDNRANERALIDDDTFKVFASLLTHEYFHSWNGKFRRPADLLSPDFQKPMQDDLLWVYEGLTEYYGDVMAARAGLWKPSLPPVSQPAEAALGAHSKTRPTWLRSSTVRVANGAIAAAAPTSMMKANLSGSTPTPSSAKRPKARNHSTTSAAPSTAMVPAAPFSAVPNQQSSLTPQPMSSPRWATFTPTTGKPSSPNA
jgi:hypothetical protein